MERAVKLNRDIQFNVNASKMQVKESCDDLIDELEVEIDT